MGERSGVLVGRIGWKILIGKEKNGDLKDILVVGKEKNVGIEMYENMGY
ncbi:RNA-binding protein [Bacillus thuringiensis]|nr:RNA-binding protein [Bacillus thuringiensis]